MFFSLSLHSLSIFRFSFAHTSSFCRRKLLNSCVSFIQLLGMNVCVCVFVLISYALAEPEFDRDVDLKLKHR